MSWRAIIVLGAILLTAATARAEERLSWSLTETLLLEWHGEADMLQASALRAHDRDNYLVLKNRANLGLRRGPLDVTLRFDQSTYWDTCPQMPSRDPQVDDVMGCRSPREGVHDDDYRIERATARFRFGRHRLTAGDFPLQVGRGIVLSLRKVSEFGIDDALRGARLELRLSDDVELDLFGGVINVNNIDEVIDTPVPEPRDRIVGGRLEGEILDVVDVGAHGVIFIPQAAEGLGTFDPDTETWSGQQDLLGGAWTGLVGGTVELPRLADRLSIYLEGDGLIRSMVNGEQQEGFALYSALDLALGRVTLMGEFKWYENFQVMGTVTEGLQPGQDPTPRRLAQAPTIEREDMPVFNNWDVLGGRVRADVSLPRGYLVYANVAYVHGRRNNLRETFHAYGGLEYRLLGGQISGTLSGGYRREFGREAPEDPLDWNKLILELIHVELNATIRMVGRHGLHLAVRHETWNEPDLSGADEFFHRGTISVGYDMGNTLSLSVAYEYDTQNDLNHYPDLLDDECQHWDVATTIRQHFGFAEIRYQPLRWLDLRLRGGTMRGGLRCLSGTCRVFPNFTGVRFETVVRF